MLHCAEWKYCGDSSADLQVMAKALFQPFSWFLHSVFYLQDLNSQFFLGTDSVETLSQLQLFEYESRFECVC